jgi:polar amino acid transport system substrate-binding protein
MDSKIMARTAGNYNAQPVAGKRRFGLFVFLAVLLTLGVSGCGTVPPDRVLVASGHADWPPVMFARDGQIDGVGPALEKKIFADLGFRAEFPYVGPWDVVQAKAKSGEVDVLVAAYKTAAREEYLAYSVPYINDPLVLFVKKGHEFPFAQDADLIGKTGVGTVGDSYGQEFDHYIQANLKFLWASTTQEALDWVKSGKADYYIYSLYSGHEELKSENSDAQFAVLPHRVAEEPFYLAISKKSPFLKYLPEINRLIQKYQADGTVDQLTAQYKAQFFPDEK